MSKREQLLVWAVLAVNVTVGIVLAGRADFTRLLHPHENAPKLALHPVDGGSTSDAPREAPRTLLARASSNDED